MNKTTLLSFLLSLFCFFNIHSTSVPFTQGDYSKFLQQDVNNSHEKLAQFIREQTDILNKRKKPCIPDDLKLPTTLTATDVPGYDNPIYELDPSGSNAGPSNGLKIGAGIGIAVGAGAAAGAGAGAAAGAAGGTTIGLGFGGIFITIPIAAPGIGIVVGVGAAWLLRGYIKNIIRIHAELKEEEKAKKEKEKGGGGGDDKDKDPEKNKKDLVPYDKDKKYQPTFKNGKYEPNPKHGSENKGDISKAPTNGQQSFDKAIDVPDKEYKVGVENKEFVMFRQHEPGKYHGYVVEYKDLPQAAKNALYNQGIIKSIEKGKLR